MRESPPNLAMVRGHGTSPGPGLLKTRAASMAESPALQENPANLPSRRALGSRHREAARGPGRARAVVSINGPRGQGGSLSWSGRRFYASMCAMM